MRSRCSSSPASVSSLRAAPAGERSTTPTRGGLVQHTLATVRLALALCDVVEQVYGAEVNRDVVIAASLLHDIMKAPCLSLIHI